jgi:oxygen-independent coproporphyrinogen-3 oxidase
LKTKKILRDEYFLNPQKAALAVSVANAEYKIMKRTAEDTCSLYISIPFCPSRSAFLDFLISIDYIIFYCLLVVSHDLSQK